MAILAAMTLDCQWVKREPPVVIRRDPSRAMLAAVRSSQMSMFGDLPGGGESSYFTRSVASLARHTVSEIGGDFDPQLDVTGKRLVFASTRHNQHPDLYFKWVNGVAVTQLTGDPASDIQPALSPDGFKVAFASDRTGSWDIWVIDMNGGPPTRLTDSPADEVHPSWSPDGTKIIYCSLPAASGQWELWVTDARSGGHRRFIGYGLFPQWSPVDDTILFQRARERGSRAFGVWTLTLVDGEPRYPTELISGAGEAMTLPAWSHDGREVAFVRTSVWPADSGTGPEWSGNSDIWIMSMEGRNPVRMTDGYTGNHSPVFAPDGSVFFTSDRAGHENIWSIRRHAQSAAGGGRGARPTERSAHSEHQPNRTSASPTASTAQGAEGL